MIVRDKRGVKLRVDDSRAQEYLAAGCVPVVKPKKKPERKKPVKKEETAKVEKETKAAEE